MARCKQGSIVLKGKSLFARITFIDESGVRRQRWRKAESKSHARTLIKNMLRDLEQHGEAALEGDRVLFREFAERFKKSQLIPAVYNDGRKVEGYRTLGPVMVCYNSLLLFFGNKRLRSITHADIQQYKAHRLSNNTVRGSQRTIATVNRELALLSKMLKCALAESLLLKNPFTGTRPLISTADENQRQRIITQEEERLLISKCTGRRKHLKSFLILAIDTGMRRGEMLKLTWADIDFEARLITIQAFNTKTMKQRQVGMTTRVVNELVALYEASNKLMESRVFKHDYVRASFEAARKDAGLEDLRWHDLRHVHATRLVAAQVPLAEVSRVLGHSSPNMTYRYVTPNVDAVRKAVAALDEFNNSMQS